MLDPQHELPHEKAALTNSPTLTTLSFVFVFASRQYNPVIDLFLMFKKCEQI